MTSEFEFLPLLERADPKSYAAFFQEVFPGETKLSETYLAWQYERNPAGRAIGFDAFLDGKLVAHYAIVPRDLSLNGQVIRAALSVNTGTAPAAQGKGLFTKLADASYQRAASLGIECVFGVANANSVHGFVKKLGFRSLGQVGLYVGDLKEPDTAGELGGKYDRDWLRWRAENPSREYFSLPSGAGRSSVCTLVRGVPFRLAELSNEDIIAAGIRAKHRLASLLIPRLSPFLSAKQVGGIRVSQRLQPSPWHAILKNLNQAGGSLPVDVPLRIRGLDMDTF